VKLGVRPVPLTGCARRPSWAIRTTRNTRAPAAELTTKLLRDRVPIDDMASASASACKLPVSEPEELEVRLRDFSPARFVAVRSGPVGHDPTRTATTEQT
jgi:hypothetical protein